MSRMTLEWPRIVTRIESCEAQVGEDEDSEG